MIKLSVQTFQLLIAIYRRGNIVFSDLGCTLSAFVLSLLFPDQKDRQRTKKEKGKKDIKGYIKALQTSKITEGQTDRQIFKII